MVLNEEIKKELALRLYEVNAFKFGDFKMKVGINSPVYFDLRVIVSHPDIMVKDLIYNVFIFMTNYNFITGNFIRFIVRIYKRNKSSQ